MKTPEGADVYTVVRIECVAKQKTRHRIEWGFRWVYEKWRISQRYATQDRNGAHTYAWNDMFDVLVGGKKMAYSTGLVWVHSRAERIVRGESQWGGGELEEPWRYTKGEEEREWAEIGDGRGEYVGEAKKPVVRLTL